MIDGVIITPLKRIQDSRGEVRHGLRCTDSTFTGFGEVYFSAVVREVVKGWKKHTKMHSNLIVVSGIIRVVLYDDRKDSSTNGRTQEFVGSIENYSRLTVPAGIWTAFQGVGNELNLLLNIASILHDPNESVNVPHESTRAQELALPVLDWSLTP